MRVPIELETARDVENFNKLCQSVDTDVRLIGKDENGSHWEFSAKSMLCTLLLSAKVKHKKHHTIKNIDWNTIWCVCEKDIYSLIKDYIKDNEPAEENQHE